MWIHENAELLNVTAACVSAVSTVFGAVFVYRGFRKALTQEKVEFEDELTKEFRDLLKLFPVSAMVGEAIPPNEMNDKLLRAFYLYFDLSNQQIFHAQQNRVSTATSVVWGQGIRSLAKRPAFRDAWKRLEARNHFDQGDFAELRWALRNPSERIDRCPLGGLRRPPPGAAPAEA